MALFRGLSSGLSRGLSLGLTGGGSGGAPAGAEFTFDVKTDNTGTSSDTSFSMNIVGTTNLDVDWGDGNTETFVTAGQKTHDYGVGNEGTYTIKLGAVNKTFERITFSSLDPQKFLDISQWGSIQWVSWQDGFEHCINLTISATDSPDLSALINAKDAFANCDALTTFPAMSFPVCTTLYGFFRGCALLTSVGAFTTTSELLTVAQMCSQTPLLTSFDVTSMDTSATTDFSQWFYLSAVDLDVSSLNIGSLTTASYMFLLNTAFSQTNYELLLVAWEGQPHNNSVDLHAGTATYAAELPATDAELARALLVSQGWTITDGGYV